MTRPIVVGAGGFGRESLDVIDAINSAAASPEYEVLGVVDRDPRQQDLDRLAKRSLRWLGTESEWLESGTDADYVAGVGSAGDRRAIDAVFAAAGKHPITLIHPSALVGSSFEIGAGSIVCGGVHISTNVTLGRSVHVNPNATVGHDVVVEDYCSVNPGAILSGAVRVSGSSTVGAGAVVLQNLTIGARSTVGAAACVTRDVPSDAVVKGVPAR